MGTTSDRSMRCDRISAAEKLSAARSATTSGSSIRRAKNATTQFNVAAVEHAERFRFGSRPAQQHAVGFGIVLVH